jgi:hypothetical protein
MAALVHPNQFDIDFSKAESYKEYFDIFFKHLLYEKDRLDNLWVVIGATNVANVVIQGEPRNDLTRFGMYDIAINNEDKVNINLKERHLISLSFKMLNIDPPNDSIYKILSKLLPKKFSRILFDWSVLKFIDAELLKQMLMYMKIMIKPGGEIYMEHDPYRGLSMMIPFKLGKNGRCFLYKNEDSPITTKEAEEMYSSQDRYPRAVFVLQDRLLKVYNVESLIPKLDEGVDWGELRSHIENPYHKNIEETTRGLPMKKLLDSIFKTDEEFNVRFVTDGLYPNNADTPEKEIKCFFVVTRNLETGGAKRRRKTNRKRRRKLSRKR